MVPLKIFGSYPRHCSLPKLFPASVLADLMISRGHHAMLLPELPCLISEPLISPLSFVPPLTRSQLTLPASPWRQQSQSRASTSPAPSTASPVSRSSSRIQAEPSRFLPAASNLASTTTRTCARTPLRRNAASGTFLPQTYFLMR